MEAELGQEIFILIDWFFGSPTRRSVREAKIKNKSKEENGWVKRVKIHEMQGGSSTAGGKRKGGKIRRWRSQGIL